MVSLLTNTSAMSALRTLAGTDKALAATERQISTGLRVADASDDAAYWAISTAMRSRVVALAAARDALDLTDAIADVTGKAIDNIIGNMQGIRKDLVTARTPGVDLRAVQQDISAKQDAIVATANSASFNGVNWLVQRKTADVAITETHTLSVSPATILAEGASPAHSQAADPQPTAPAPNYFSVVFSTQPYPTPYAFTDRISYQAIATETDSTGTTRQETDTFDGTDQDEAYSYTYWYSDRGTWRQASPEPIYRTSTEPVTGSNYTRSGSVDFSDTQAVHIPDGLGSSTLDIDVSGLALFTNYTGTITVDESTDNGAYAYDWVGTHWNSNLSTTAAYTSFDTDNGFEVNPGALDVNIGGSDASTNRASVPEDNLAMSTKRTVLNFNVDGSDPARRATDIDAMRVAVDGSLSALVTMGAKVGAVRSQVAIQRSFNSALSDALTSGVGSLVDADMDVASTRLQAIQTQQRLGIQALSIANDNSRQILKLFG